MVKPLKHKPNILERLHRSSGKAWNSKLAEVRSFPKDKGDYLGSCNRSACLKPGADWFNHSTRKYYCVSCADWLNTDRFNKADAMNIWGHDLCTEGKYDESKFQKLHDLHRNAKNRQKELNFAAKSPQ